MGCATSKTTTIRDPNTIVTSGDVYDFVELHCELSPKAHVSYMELAGALYTFLKSRSRRVDPGGLWPHSVMAALVEFHNLTVCGPFLEGARPHAYRTVCGVRIKVYPDPAPMMPIAAVSV